MPIDIEREINRAAIVGTRLEHLVYSKAKEGKLVVVDRDADDLSIQIRPTLRSPFIVPNLQKSTFGA